ncbi:MAG: DUF1292 domain-containing protein [Lachnospiraceae bacterium]|nr:DUF1292 domain-containing protein [Lachnospiraceae bacterium]
MAKNQTFQVMTEDGKTVEAELLNVVEIDGKDYAVYSILNDDFSIDYLASYVVKDEEGYDMLTDITDERDREKIAAFIKEQYSE